MRDRLITEGRIVNTAAREGHFKLWVADDPAVPRAGPSTAPALHDETLGERAGVAHELTVALGAASRHLQREL